MEALQNKHFYLASLAVFLSSGPMVALLGLLGWWLLSWLAVDGLPTFPNHDWGKVPFMLFLVWIVGLIPAYLTWIVYRYVGSTFSMMPKWTVLISTAWGGVLTLLLSLWWFDNVVLMWVGLLAALWASLWSNYGNKKGWFSW